MIPPVSVRLFVGLSFAGELISDVEVVPLTMLESMRADGEVVAGRPDEVDEKTWAACCRVARQIRVPGRPELRACGLDLASTIEVDGNAILAAAKEVRLRVESFRGARAAPATGDGAGGQSPGLQPGGSGELHGS